MEIIKNLDINFVLSIAGMLVGLIGILLSIHFYYKSKNKKVLSYARKAYFWVSSKHKDIDVQYKGENIEKIVYQIYEFQNQGNVSIKKTDISENEPIKLSSTDSCTLIGIEIGETYECNIEVKYNKDDCSEAVLLFDYLNPKSAFIVNVFTLSTKEDEVNITGMIIDGQIRDRGELQDRSELQQNIFNMKLFVVLFFVCMIIAFIPLNGLKTVLCITIALVNFIMAIIYSYLAKGLISKLSK